jgi:hypothetical protein
MGVTGQIQPRGRTRMGITKESPPDVSAHQGVLGLAMALFGHIDGVLGDFDDQVFIADNGLA